LSNQNNLGVEIVRDVETNLYPFTDYFRGFEKVPGVRALFGDKTEEILGRLKVEFYSSKFGYMGVSDEDGHIMVSSYHLKTSDFAILYLDVFHELHHVKQFIDGKKIYLLEFEYVDSPVEIEAYLPTVDEARRIGFTDDQIREYLKVEWISDEQYERLLTHVGLNAKT
jgi:hypothetical protein